MTLLTGETSNEASRFPELCVNSLFVQLHMFIQYCKQTSVHSARDSLLSMLPDMHVLFCDYEQFIRLLLVMPATAKPSTLSVHLDDWNLTRRGECGYETWLRDRFQLLTKRIDRLNRYHADYSKFACRQPEKMRMLTLERRNERTKRWLV